MTISPHPGSQQHFESHQWTTESRRTLSPQIINHQHQRSESRGSTMTIPDPVDRHVAKWRSESRNSNRDKVFRNDEEFSQQDEIVNNTISALSQNVEQTTEIIRRKNEQMRIERRQFQTEMEVTGRMEVDPADDWLTARLKNVSSDEMRQNLEKVKKDQRQNAVTDTLAALVYDVNATTEVLRRAHAARDRENASKNKKEEIEYRLRLTPAPEDPPPQRQVYPNDEEVEETDFSHQYGVQLSEETDSLRRRRARSTTPRRTLHISGSPPPPAAAVCAYCSEEIDGPILTALAPNSERAQKFHTYHFMCTYCQKALNMHGTFREHDRKPYCHDCFYKLYNGLQYAPDEHQATIEKLI